MLSMLLVPAAVQAEPPVQKIAQPKTIEEFSARSLGETEPEHGGAGPGPAENYAFDAPKNATDFGLYGRILLIMSCVPLFLSVFQENRSGPRAAPTILFYGFSQEGPLWCSSCGPQSINLIIGLNTASSLTF